MILEPGLRAIEGIRLDSLLGEGGMGQIWAAEDLSLCRRVAVKFLAEPLADSIEAFQRFTLEARTMARLASPHVPQVFDYGSLPDGTPYLVMELLRGSDLHARLATGHLLSLDETVKLLTQVGSVLSTAHGLGIVHRDIKPENIFLAADATGFVAKLLDFGIAKASVPELGDGMTETGTTLGTPWYMSPEQLLGSKDVDGRADLWSLAVVAYHALTGKLPFAGDTFGAVCFAVQAGVFADPSSIRADLPPALDGWFRKALRRSPGDRFPSAADMVEAFSEAATSSTEAPWMVAGTGEAAWPIPLTRRRPARRHGRKTVVASALVALVAVLAAGHLPGAFRPHAQDAGSDGARRAYAMPQGVVFGGLAR